VRAQAAILIRAKALGKPVIAALVRLQTQRGMVSGNALSGRMLVGRLGFFPDLDRLMEMSGAGFGVMRH
jgi:hypothetical protein